jgi:hypothetical protein
VTASSISRKNEFDEPKERLRKELLAYREVDTLALLRLLKSLETLAPSE